MSCIFYKRHKNCSIDKEIKKERWNFSMYVHLAWVEPFFFTMHVLEKSEGTLCHLSFQPPDTPCKCVYVCGVCACACVCVCGPSCDSILRAYPVCTAVDAIVNCMDSPNGYCGN